MNKIVFLFGIVGIAIYFLFIRPWIIQRRRRVVASQPFPAEWGDILVDFFPLYSRLPDHLKLSLRKKILVFLSEKQFQGKKGLVIDDTIRVLVAAQACILILNRPSDFFPKLTTIILYPSTFFSTQQQRKGSIIVEKKVYRTGESWLSGPLVLAWDASKLGAQNMHDGHNVVIHEFTHQLDQEDHASDGVPELSSGSFYRTWIQVMSREYKALLSKTKKHQKTVLDKYGATSPAEFFAVATESFFEKPAQMNEKHAELYQLLKSYYALDPLSWMKEGNQ